MFIETYYDETKAIPANTGEPAIPYPELVGEELALWRSYLPFRRSIESFSEWFEFIAPEPVVTEVKRVKETRLFDRVEIWARSDPDPMAVGLKYMTSGDTRYYSIVRWGDAKITLAQVKRKLRAQQWLIRMIGCAGILVVAASFFFVAYG
jgi:hypothetical protein